MKRPMRNILRKDAEGVESKAVASAGDDEGGLTGGPVGRLIDVQSVHGASFTKDANRAMGYLGHPPEQIRLVIQLPAPGGRDPVTGQYLDKNKVIDMQARRLIIEGLKRLVGHDVIVATEDLII